MKEKGLNVTLLGWQSSKSRVRSYWSYAKTNIFLNKEILDKIQKSNHFCLKYFNLSFQLAFSFVNLNAFYMDLDHSTYEQ